MRTSSIAATLLGLGTSAYAQISSTSKSGITYSFSVPDTTASSGSGDVYISISGPTSFGWIGMGSGSGMSGSKMFIIYQNAAGTNVTLSPRTGSGHNMPSFDSSAQAVLVEGTGISGDTMTAVIRCSDCSSKFDITSSSASLIYGAKSGSIKSDDQSESISQHDNTYGTITMDMTSAKNSANSNPFASGSTSTTNSTTGTGTATVSCVPISQTSSDASQTSSGRGLFGFGGSHPTGRPPWATGTAYAGDDSSKVKREDNACPSGTVPSTSTSNNGASSANEGLSASQRTSMLMAHGIMAGLAFAVFFPFGAISIRLMSFPGLVAFHAVFQIAAYLFYIIAFGLGVYLANQMRMLDQTHPIIGILLFVLLLAQPILGWMHHNNFKRFQSRTLPSYMHIWLGRIVITLGIVNGGLGFKLADNTKTGPIAYAVIAAIFYLVYVVAIIIGEKRRRNGRRDAPPKYDEVLMENVTPPTSPPRHREFYGAGRK